MDPHVDQFKIKTNHVSRWKILVQCMMTSTGSGDHVHYLLVNSKKQADFLIILLINSRLGMFLQTMNTWFYRIGQVI